MIETEIKLIFESVEAARQAVQTAGGRLAVSSRLIDDRLFDTPGQSLRQAGGSLRVRRDGARAFITFKGPVQPGAHKSREEVETSVGDATVAEAIVIALGFQPVFRAQKHREEYELGGAHVTVDQTPMGVFVEIEARDELIAPVARSLGRSPDDYRLESYPRLWWEWCAAHDMPAQDMMLTDGAADLPPSRGASADRRSLGGG